MSSSLLSSACPIRSRFDLQESIAQELMPRVNLDHRLPQGRARGDELTAGLQGVDCRQDLADLNAGGHALFFASSRPFR